jgi:hypothetical protein
MAIPSWRLNLENSFPKSVVKSDKVRLRSRSHSAMKASSDSSEMESLSEEGKIVTVSAFNAFAGFQGVRIPCFDSSDLFSKEPYIY